LSFLNSIGNKIPSQAILILSSTIPIPRKPSSHNYTAFWQKIAEIEDSITGLKQEIRQILENRARELATEMEIQASAAEAVLDKEITEADKNQQIQNV
jgi:hypothetical protein